MVAVLTGIIPTILALIEGIQGSLSLYTKRAGSGAVVVKAERKLKLRRRRRTDPQNLSASRFLS